MITRSKVLMALAAWVLWATAGAAQTTTVYTDEGAFLAALGGATIVHEGFEDEPPWDAVRSTIFGGTHTAPSITNVGITWQSNHAANEITTGPGAAYDGGWGFYSLPHGDQSVNPTDNIHDGFVGSSAITMNAVGGWFTGTANSNLVVMLDGGAQIALGPVGGSFQFYGVVVTGGTFTSFEFREIDGTLEDQRIIFADEFTIAGSFPAANNPPNGTIVQPAGNPTIAVNQSVTFSGTASDPDGDAVAVLWQFGDGATSTLLSPGAHTYTAPGSYTVTFTATDQYGLSDPTPDGRTVTVTNTAPNGTIVQPAGNPTITVNQSVTFSGTASDPDGDAVAVLWQFGDGATSTLLSPGAHTYTAPGSYTVTFTATDSRGLSDPTPDTRTVTVTNTAPNGTIVQPGGNPTITVDQSVTFSGTASEPDGDTVTVLWQLGDGATSTLLTPGAHTYTVAGIYTVTFTVTDSHGFADPTPDSRTVTVNEPANTPPVANAGPDQSVPVTQTATLDGSASADADGDPLTFVWSFVSKPAASTTTLTNPTSIHPTFVVDAPGSYVVHLVVNDGTVDSAADTVTISTTNSAPVANAGPDQTALVTQTVILDGSASTDIDGDPITYAWSFVSKPAASTATLTNPTSVSPTLVIDEPGLYTVRLIVNDGTVDSAQDTVTISTTNSAPVANAGPDQAALVTQTVTLDGSASSDVDGDPLTYAWSFSSKPAGSTTTLTNPTSVNPSFTIDEPGTYIVQLIVNDGTVDSAADHVHISTENSAPVANAGPDQSALVGHTVTLDSSASSDVDGDPLTYAWSFSSKPAGSTTTLTNPTSVNPSFTIDEPGTYIVRLIVNDGTVNSAPDSVTVSTDNSAPVANAGPNQSVLVAQIATLDGSGSFDVDGDPLTSRWSFSSKPAGSTATLTNPTTVNPSFLVDVSGTYVVQLIVNDGTIDSAPDTVAVSTDNSPPVANAGPDQTVPVGGTAYLDGSGSSDVDGDALTWAWSFSSKPGGSGAALSDPAAVNPSFVVDVAGTYVVQLIANDGVVNSAPDTVTISTSNSAPVAYAGPDQTVAVGAMVFLDGSGSADVDHDPLTFAWSFSSKPGGSIATLSDPTTANTTFTADAAGAYIVQLIVSDGALSSAPDTVTIRTTNDPPDGVIVQPSGDVTVAVGEPLYFEGRVVDPNGDPTTVLWRFGDGTTSSALAPGNHAYSQEGSYTVTFTAVDAANAVDPTPDTRRITVSGGSAVPATDGVVSGVADIRGFEGSDWHTDLYLHNASGGDIVVELSFGIGSGLVGTPVSRTVGPNRTEALEDVVSSVFATQGSGAVFWRVVTGDPARLMVNANTYNRVDSARRFGQQVPGIRWSSVPAAGTPMYVPALAGSYRTNLGLATDGDCSQVIVRGYDRQGALRVERTLQMQPTSWTQLDRLFRSAFPGLIDDPDTVPVADSLHRFEVVGVDGKVVAYASIVDNATNDGSYMTGLEAGGQIGPAWLPGAAFTRGINDSQWRSDVIGFNLAGRAETASVTWYPSQSDNGGDLEARDLAMAADEGAFLGNILGDGFGLVPPAVGSVCATLPGGLFWMRTYTEETDPDLGSVTYGQAIPAHSAAEAIPAGGEGRVFGFSADDGTRSNLVLQNMCRNASGALSPVNVRIVVLDRTGAALAERSYPLRAGEYVQHNQFIPAVGVGQLVGGALRILPEAGDGSCASGGVAAMVSEVNGAAQPGTNDARLVTSRVVSAG